MGVKERRVRQKETLREEILDAARELFVKEGYHQVSMRRIAEKIEYSPTTIYLHFKDKSELLHCLCEETLARLLRTFESLSDARSDPLTRLKKGLRAYIEFGLQNPNHYKVVFLMDHQHKPADRRYHGPDSSGRKAYRHLRSLVEECVKQKKFRKLEPEIVSQTLWAGIHGVTALLIVMGDFPWVKPGVLIDSVIETMAGSLRA